MTDSLDPRTPIAVAIPQGLYTIYVEQFDQLPDGVTATEHAHGVKLGGDVAGLALMGIRIDTFAELKAGGLSDPGEFGHYTVKQMRDYARRFPQTSQNPD